MVSVMKGGGGGWLVAGGQFINVVQYSIRLATHHVDSSVLFLRV